MTTSSSPRPRQWTSALIIAAIARTTSPFPIPLRSTAVLDGRRSHCTKAAGAPLRASPSENDAAEADGGDDGGVRRGRARRARLPERNLYDVLGADRGMSRPEIKRRYLQLARETHPDSAAAAFASAADPAADEFNRIARAWTVLSDPKARRAYDRELAAAGFTEDVVKRAGAVAKEVGPPARRFYDDVAIPFLRRTTATTLAGWSAVSAEVAAADGTAARARAGGRRDGRDASLTGVTLSEVVSDVPEGERRSMSGEDFGRAFQRAVEAGRDATRQVRGQELREESAELRRRADETRAASLEILERLTDIKGERMRLTLLTPAANFTSADAVQYLDECGNNDGRADAADDEVTLLQRMAFKHPLRENVAAFAEAEAELGKRAEEKSEVDRLLGARQRALQEAENNYRAAMKAEERARKMLEDSQKRVAVSEQTVAEAKSSIRDLYAPLKRSDQEVSKAGTLLKRKREVVRRELKQRADRVEGATMTALGFGTAPAVAAVEALREDERRTEGDFLRRVGEASRLTSQAETLRLRAEELLGEGRPAAAGGALGDGAPQD